MGIDAQEAGKEIDQAMKEAGKAVDKLDESVKKLIDDLKKLIELMKQAGISGGQQGGSGGGNTAGAAGAGAAQGTAAVAGAQGAIQSASPSKVMQAVGGDFAQGFVNGINGGNGDVSSAAANLAQGSVDAVNSTLGTASPSKIMREIAHWFCEGFWRGIEEEREHCRKACEDVAVVVVQTFKATSTLNAQFNTGVLYGKSLADGIVASISAVKLASGKLATAATTEATAMLAKMGYVGQAGSGAQMPTGGGAISLPSGTAQQGGSRHCVHEHRLYLDGREIRDITDRRVAKALDRLTDQFSQQKR
jgi:hypothetical protein